ncbi:uncharacterized protein VTP21DRAFT_8888 [Calcarisporiella thermophila]|uniref:uncharacterized protein n=1 Tax=Calcarisporiella thermophila TaxID=911321 RepID=UPI00374491D5
MIFAGSYLSIVAKLYPQPSVLASTGYGSAASPGAKFGFRSTVLESSANMHLSCTRSGQQPLPFFPSYSSFFDRQASSTAASKLMDIIRPHAPQPTHPVPQQQQQPQHAGTPRRAHVSSEDLDMAVDLPPTPQSQNTEPASTTQLAEFAAFMMHAMCYSKRATTTRVYLPGGIPASVPARVTTLIAPNPSPAFKKFCDQILSATQLSEWGVLLALKYIALLARDTNLVTQGVEGSEYRFFTVALMLSSKFLDDNTFTNKTWSEVSGLNLLELNRTELEFLEAMQYRLVVPGAEYHWWHEALDLFCGKLSMDERQFADQALRVFGILPVEVASTLSTKSTMQPLSAHSVKSQQCHPFPKECWAESIKHSFDDLATHPQHQHQQPSAPGATLQPVQMHIHQPTHSTWAAPRNSKCIPPAACGAGANGATGGYSTATYYEQPPLKHPQPNFDSHPPHASVPRLVAPSSASSVHLQSLLASLRSGDAPRVHCPSDSTTTITPARDRYVPTYSRHYDVVRDTIVAAGPPPFNAVPAPIPAIGGCKQLYANYA